MVPVVDVITNELIFNVELLPITRTTSVFSVEPEVPLNESSFFAQEMMVRLKRDMRIMYKTLFIFFPISWIVRNCNGAVVVGSVRQGIEGYSIISRDCNSGTWRTGTSICDGSCFCWLKSVIRSRIVSWSCHCCHFCNNWCSSGCVYIILPINTRSQKKYWEDDEQVFHLI